MLACYHLLIILLSELDYSTFKINCLCPFLEEPWKGTFMWHAASTYGTGFVLLENFPSLVLPVYIARSSQSLSLETGLQLQAFNLNADLMNTFSQSDYREICKNLFQSRTFIF